MKWFKNLLLFFLLFSFSTSTVYALTFPKPTGYVNDYANLYSDTYEQNLEKQIADFEKTSRAEIAVVTVTDLQESTIEEYAVKLFEAWKIGKDKSDNGILLLIAKNEREVRIEVGYGLEPVITDARAGRIIRNDITPKFKNNDFEGGTTAGVNTMQKYIKGEPVPETTKQPPAPSADFIFNLIPFFFLFITYIFSYMARSKEFVAGGILGGLLGTFFGVFVGSFQAVIIAGGLLGLFGLGLDYVLSKNYKKLQEHNRPTDWWHSGGGFFGGGSSGGGGFGGFGGGSSGGGGASGRW